MAARNSSRGARRRGRSGGNRPRTDPPRSAKEKPAAKGPSATELLIREIRLLALRLEVIYRTAVTVEMALRYQNADQDADVADCLRHAVCEAVWRQSEKAHGLSTRFSRMRVQDRSRSRVES
jgi:hypothetical protein